MTVPRRGAAPSIGLKLRLGVGALFALLAVYLLLVLPPLHLGAVRLGELSLAWWYGGVLAPLFAVILTIACLGSNPMSGPPPLTGRIAIWIMPPLLFSLPIELLVEGRDGLWIALLVVVAPLIALLLVAVPGGTMKPVTGMRTPVVVVVALLLWAQLLLAGDLAASLGFPRLAGILTAACGALLVTGLSPRGQRWRALLPIALLALFVPLVVIIGVADRLPHEAWSAAASRLAFRFAPDSPWVVGGRPIQVEPGVETLLFEEEHRITVLTEGPLRLMINDRGKTQIYEWTLAAGQSINLRPGDRLFVEPGRRLLFEAGKRVPGAPVWGLRWADTPFGPLGPGLLWLLGAGLTVVGGALAILTYGRSVPTSRLTGALGGISVLLILLWAEGWAIYTVSEAPEIFLGGLSPSKLFELPVLILPGSRWGPALRGLTMFGGYLALLANAVALRELLARRKGERVGGLWVAMLAAATVGSMWVVDPWMVLLIALGLAASTLAPLAWAALPPGRAQAATAGVGTGAAVFLGLTVLRQLQPVPGPWAEPLLTYPALVAAPVSAFILWVLRGPER
ncbi:MAG: hypothetical protein ACE5JN_16140 [Candidatus Methylomirabilia bacterium]